MIPFGRRSRPTNDLISTDRSQSQECAAQHRPKSDDGKQRSRRNALRQGLTAETVIDRLADAEDSRGFQATVIADYDAQTAVERELVLRALPRCCGRSAG
jgi:hypothetical protein